MQLSKNRILYIEDHDDTRELVSLLLRQHGFDVITGSTIESGIDLAVTGTFDLYLLDSWLPDGSGLDLCRKIREFDQHTPILFYSAAAYEKWTGSWPSSLVLKRIWLNRVRLQSFVYLFPC